MLTTSLLPLPPPSASLLPSLSQPVADPSHHQHPQHPQARRKHAYRLNTPLTSLSHDERLIASRKLAIAMYGYSWLKPAGCSKTMLGRREEELEKEEVERQLREVEAQERMVMEQEEQERQEELRRQAEGGEVEGVGERDLDDEVPEAEEEGSDHDEEGSDEDREVEDEDGDEEDMEGDLDDDIPDADADGQESSWVYDTRREPDTESEEGDDAEDGHRRGYRIQPSPPRHLTEEDDPAAAAAMVNAMLDEDELGEYEHQHDLDDDVPDMDRDLDADMDMDMDATLSDHDLDADVPSADEDRGWEHTDSELEESEMDISLLPTRPDSSSRNAGTTHEEMRRVSGNSMLRNSPSLLPPGPAASSQPAWPRRPDRPHPRHAPPQPYLPPPRTGQRRPTQRTMMQTPATEDEISALISTGGPSTTGTDTRARQNQSATVADSTTTDPSPTAESRSPTRRNWLNLGATTTRRNLFGGLRGTTGTRTSDDPSARTTDPESTGHPQTQPRTRATAQPTTSASSGGLFTPRSPRRLPPATTPELMPPPEDLEPPRSRTRSGRLLAGIQVGRRPGRPGREGAAGGNANGNE